MSTERPEWMHEDEAFLTGEGLGYSDEQRTASLDDVRAYVDLLRGVEPWRLTPYTSGLFEIERALSYLVERVKEGPGGEDALDKAEEALGK